MNKKFIIILSLLISIVMVACATTNEDNVIVETFENIVDTFVTVPIEEIFSTMDPTEPTTLPHESKPVLFDENITFTYEYIKNGDVMPYGLFIPSSANESISIPLIVFLHGAGERDCTESWFAGAGLPRVLNNWKLDGFNAYVICPHLHGSWNLLSWNNSHVAKNIMDILNKFTSEHNVNMENIVIVGHSLGGLGAMYMPIEYPYYFSKAIVMSSLELGNGDIKEINIPVLGCIENMQNQFHFMNSEFKDVFGEDSVWNYESSHNYLPDVAFTEDKDNDNHSDIVEWMFDCNTEPVLFDENITFTYEYINNGDVMPYGLFTPSTASDGESKPLIVWLHGKGEFGITEAEFNNKSLPKILKESEFEGFDAYVICPHVTGYYWAEHWFWNNAVNNVKNLLDWCIEEYNIDTSKITITGHSSGGVGAMYIAHEFPTYFSKMAILSGQSIGDKIYEINIPAKGYVENSGVHYNYMKYVFEPVFGEENLTVYNAPHSDINEIVFAEDLDGNNRIDVIEWLLEDN